MIEELEARLRQKEEEGESATPAKEQRPSRSSSTGPPGSKEGKKSNKELRSKSVGAVTHKMTTKSPTPTKKTTK